MPGVRLAIGPGRTQLWDTRRYRAVRVLIADDNRLMLEGVRRQFYSILGDEGGPVVTAALQWTEPPGIFPTR